MRFRVLEFVHLLRVGIRRDFQRPRLVAIDGPQPRGGPLAEARESKVPVRVHRRLHADVEVDEAQEIALQLVDLLQRELDVEAREVDIHVGAILPDLLRDDDRDEKGGLPGAG